MRATHTVVIAGVAAVAAAVVALGAKTVFVSNPKAEAESATGRVDHPDSVPPYGVYRGYPSYFGERDPFN